MLRTLRIAALCGISLHAAEFADQRISEVVGAPASLQLETRAGNLFDSQKLKHDVHTIWSSGRVSDVQVEAVPDGDSIRVIFRLKRKMQVRVRRIRLDPPTPGVRVQMEPGVAMDLQEAQQVAADVAKQLVSSGYPDATAEGRLMPAGPGSADLEIHVKKQRPIDVARVTVSGDLGTKRSDVYHALRATRAKTILPGWRVSPGYTPDAVQSDLANLRSFYYRRGYFDADVRADSVDFANSKAYVAFAVNAGPRYGISSLNGLPLRDGSRNPGDAVCRELFEERRQAERMGVFDFTARVDIHDGAANTTVTPGPAYEVGRIDFRGNHRVRDVTLRRMLVLDEGAPLDQHRLRQSLARLNRTGWFEPITERDVVVNTPADSRRANVSILLKERKTRSWYLSGPAGPMSIGGSLRFAIGSRLPPWGQGLLELSTYTASLNLMLLAKPLGTLIPFLPNRRFLQILTIERPVIPGQTFLSGFTIVPQWGWQGLLAGYGVSHTRNFFTGLLQTDRALEPDLLVTVAHEGHEGTMRCEPPRLRSDRVRQFAGAAVNLLFSFSPL
jgi:Surface antigen variable number repeat